MEDLIDDLIVASLRHRISQAEESQLLAWRQASLAHEQRYQDIVRIWSWAGSPAVEESVSQAPSVDELLEPRRSPSQLLRRGKRVPLRVRHIARAFAIAASALVAVFVGYQWKADRDGSKAAFGVDEFVTGATDVVTAELGDGSVVRLAPRSRLRVLNTEGERQVWLDGQAFFAVAKQKGHPFIVRTRMGTARVLGTRFDLRVSDHELQLAVTEGRVALAAEGKQVEVGAGQVSHVMLGAGPTLETVVEPDSLLGWMGGFLVFQDTPLSTVAREVGQRYGIRVELPDSSIADRTVTAWFTTQSAEDVLTTVCRVVDARCAIRGKRASIEP